MSDLNTSSSRPGTPSDLLSNARLVYRKSHDSDAPPSRIASPTPTASFLRNSRRLSHEYQHHSSDQDQDQDTDNDVDTRNQRERHVSSTILPPAGFFSPKKASSRPGAVSPVGSRARSHSPFANLEHANHDNYTTTNHNGSSTSVYTDTATHSFNPNHAQSHRPASPWGLAQSNLSLSSSVPHDHPLRDRNRNRADTITTTASSSGPQHFAMVERSGSGAKSLRIAKSTDPLLPARAVAMPEPAHHPFPNSDSQRAIAKNSTSTNKNSNSASSPATRVADVAVSMPSSNKGPRQRKHKHHRGANRFFFGGLIMMSDDNPIAFIASLALMLVLAGLFFGFEASWIIDNISPAVIAVFAYVWLMALVNMLVTAWRDPGVVPRDLDPDPPCTLGASAASPNAPLADPEDPLAIPVQRIIRVRGQEIPVKWCETCGTYRPPRSSHCRVCDNCVENIDHHCTFLNTCIGRRNYVPFMVFLAASIVSACIVIAMSAVHIVLLTKPASYAFPRGARSGPGLTFRQALAETPVSAVLFLLTIGALGPIMTLFVYHLRLVALNRTTVEEIRISTAREYGEKWDMAAAVANETPRILRLFGWRREHDPNPFASGRVRRNIRNGLGWRSVALESWIDRRGWYQEDLRRENPASAP